MKTPSLNRTILLPVFVLFFPALNAHASDGVIHFQGAIVEEPCQFKALEQSVKLSCAQNGKPVVQTVTLNQLDNFKPKSDAQLTTQIHYLDAHQKLAILEVTYR